MHIIIPIITIIAIFIAYVASRPSIFRVTRSTTISAPPEKIFALVNDFHQWEAWSPWAKMDPNAKTTYEGSASGIGAIMRWAGNMKVGTGSATITNNHAPESITIRLNFLKPMKGTNTAEFTFKPDSTGTLVTWDMAGKSNFMAKAMGLIINCEKMVSQQFDQGLAQIKSIAESK